ncbi:MAG: PorT family protein [Flavobacteriia bacterium]|nr:PorT family protein [Flavobacteriia bacterium]
MLKRASNILVWLLLTSSVGWSQTTFNGGFFIGLTSNQIDGDGIGGFDHTGAQGGFFANRDFNDTWSARIELQYIWRGSREKLSDTSSFYRTDLHQISVPIVAEYHFTPKISIEAGPSLDINVITSEEDIYGDLGPDPPYSPFVLNSIIGVNYAITEHTIVNLRSHYSITSIRDVRIVRRAPGLFGDWISGSHTASLTLAVYFYF